MKTENRPKLTFKTSDTPYWLSQRYHVFAWAPEEHHCLIDWEYGVWSSKGNVRSVVRVVEAKTQSEIDYLKSSKSSCELEERLRERDVSVVVSDQRRRRDLVRQRDKSFVLLLEICAEEGASWDYEVTLHQMKRDLLPPLNPPKEQPRASSSSKAEPSNPIQTPKESTPVRNTTPTTAAQDSKPSTVVPDTSKPSTVVPDTSKPSTVVPDTSKPSTPLPESKRSTAVQHSKPTTAAQDSKPSSAVPDSSKPKPSATVHEKKPNTAAKKADPRLAVTPPKPAEGEGGRPKPPVIKLKLKDTYKYVKPPLQRKMTKTKRYPPPDNMTPLPHKKTVNPPFPRPEEAGPDPVGGVSVSVSDDYPVGMCDPGPRDVVGDLLSQANSLEGPIEEDILEASKRGNIPRIKALLKNDISPNIRDEHGNTPLFWAAYRGRKDVVKVLIRGGAWINLSNREKRTPLHAAVFEGHMDIVKMLLRRGATVEAVNMKGESPLHEAALAGNMQMVKVLLDNDAPVNATSTNGTTPLIFASEKGHICIVQMLLLRGALIEVGQKSAIQAAVGGQQKQTETLLQKHKKQRTARWTCWTRFCSILRYIFCNNLWVNSLFCWPCALCCCPYVTCCCPCIEDCFPDDIPFCPGPPWKTASAPVCCKGICYPELQV
uniref:Uncharacterized protein n=1 Tax=Chromera velia CCMP2878 TaxID=1169474 RepID=A0A0G4HEK7_9ALVE|eukprot:Cvel_6520.t1-p1 / transcript=Cvel_6520.t1 / gene=Cvel_6520 / organism=Chromera_velia_CCMP2878 / gene_product=Serine/threonine-protein phosphatase 6 regulatory, putative / transcript_product=Serine/threonine-protein phosphatase 6 regulatory, putative / location=Cvel_scaffold320:84209-86886(-) / protein_length=655 / sequence_SO=supercontig / SO=protein_coding / is_pseudo=false